MTRNPIYDASDGRILLLDGAYGTMMREYSGRSGGLDGSGCQRRSEIMRDLHLRYLEAGADIIETDIGCADYASARAAAVAAREAADDFIRRHPNGRRFVAGALYPTECEPMEERVEGLLDGGADLLIFETATSVRGALAGLSAASKAAAKRGANIPTIISATLNGAGTLPSGESIGEFGVAIADYDLLAAGFNCSTGSAALLRPLERLAGVCRFRISACPSAGLPDANGAYGETPEIFAANVGEYMKMGAVDIVGGCCGTSPDHIARLAQIAARYAPRRTLTR